MEIAVLWFGLAVVIGVAASHRGRSGFGWFLLTVFISPVLTGLLLLALPRLNDPQSQRATPDTHVRCPDCRELVLRDARRCKHCGITLIPQ